MTLDVPENRLDIFDFTLQTSVLPRPWYRLLLLLLLHRRRPALLRHSANELDVGCNGGGG